MDTKRLEAYIKIVDLGTFRGAAEHLNISQPSLTQFVKDLEAHFQAQLLARTKAGVTATEAGKHLYRHAQAILKHLQQARSQIGRPDTEIAGEISLGMAGAIAPALAVPLLLRVRQALPLVRVSISEGSHGRMAEMTANGRLDLSVSTDVGARGLTGDLLLEEELVLLCDGPTQTTLPPGLLRLEMLQGYPLCTATTSGIGLKHHARDILAHLAGLDIVAEFDSAHDLVRAAESGIGAALVGELAASQLGARLTVRRFTPALRRDVYIWEPTEFPASGAAMRVKTLLKDVVRELLLSKGPQGPS